MRAKCVLALLGLFIIISPLQAQTTAFTYQGKLVNNGSPATGNYDLQFKLFNMLSGGIQLGTTQIVSNVAVANGIFTVQLDFGACDSCFNGEPRWLDISVRLTGGGAFTQLSPRQPITSTPYATKTANLVFNGAFNDGATFFTASNTFAGEGTGGNTTPNPDLLNTGGKFNSFYGAGAGQANSTGFNNDFFGSAAGQANTTGNLNAFFGRGAGQATTEGFYNAFFGGGVGSRNTTGVGNTLIGTGANFSATNTTGTINTALGYLSSVTANLSNATAIGAFGAVTQSDSLILGAISGVNNCTPLNNCNSAKVGIGTTTPSERLHVVGNGLFDGNLTVIGTLNATLPTGSANYIQNQSATAQAGNFNLLGSGTVGGTLSAGVVNAVSQYNIVSPALGSSIRLLGISGSGDTNTFLGHNAAAANPTGSFNSFFGNGAGQSTVDGGNNCFFGSGAGNVNVSGADNTFFGRNAGNANTASENAFFGSFAGAANTIGSQNTFFGKEAGRNNTDGQDNAFFGNQAGLNNTASSNSFFGYSAGLSTTTGGSNSFFGAAAGKRNTTGIFNSFFGTATGEFNTTGSLNAFFGFLAGGANADGSNNAFFGNKAGLANARGANNTFVGDSADFNTTNSTGNYNTLLGSNTRVNAGLTNATAIGANASVSQNNALILGSINGINNATADTNVGIGTTAPTFKLHIIDGANTGLRVQTNTAGGTVASFGGNGAFHVDAVGTPGGRFYITEDGKVGIGLDFNGSPDKLAVNGTVSLLLASGGSTQICKNNGNQLSTCSSSLRYKTNIATWPTGLSLISRLRPVTFDWKQNGEHDLGLVAEEVANVEPLLVTHNAKGEIEGVKYDRVAVVLLNAVKEQQHLIEQQQHQIEALKNLVCSSHRKALVCK